MTKREAKKYVVRCLQQQLTGDIDNGSEWLHGGFKDDEPGRYGFDEKDQARVRAVVQEFIDADTLIAYREPTR